MPSPLQSQWGVVGLDSRHLFHETDGTLKTGRLLFHAQAITARYGSSTFPVQYFYIRGTERFALAGEGGAT